MGEHGEQGGEQGGEQESLDWAKNPGAVDEARGTGSQDEGGEGSGGGERDDHREEGGEERQEGKQEGEEQGGGDAGDESGSESPGEYEPFNYPEGFKVDDKELQLFHEFGKEKELDQETMQSFIDYVTQRDGRAFKAEDDRQDKEAADWVEKAKADKEIGGDKFDENILRAKSALQKVGTPELMKVLMGTGWVNHPEFVRLFVRIAPMVTQDQIGEESGGQGGRELTREERLLGPEMLADLAKA